MDANLDPNAIAPTPPAAPTPAPAPVPQPQALEGEEHQGEEQNDDAGQPANGQSRKPIQPRINELTRARHEAERQAAYWRGIAEARATAATPSPAPAPAARPPKPTKDQFESYDDYVEALTDWKTEERVSVALTKVNQNIEERQSRQTAAQKESERTSVWQQRQEAVQAAIPDYLDVVANSDVPIAKHVGDLLLDSEHGPALAYKLAKDPALAEKLNGMSERQAAIQLGRLEATLEAAAPAPAPTTAAPNAPAQTPAPAQAVRVSKAPAPPNALPGSRTPATTPDLSKLPMDEYVKARKSQGAAWGRG
jgi:hypothetical protein